MFPILPVTRRCFIDSFLTSRLSSHLGCEIRARLSSGSLKNNPLSDDSYFLSSNLLSTENRESCKKSLRTLDSLRPPKDSPNKNLKTAAVFVPLISDEEGYACLLYTRRSERLRKHAREVSFPGGLSDTNDLNIVNTALRETEEEIGINLDSIDVWGTMKPVGNKTGSTAVTPVVGQVTVDPRNISNLKINLEEVSDVFAVRIKTLADSSSCKYTQFRVTNNPSGYTLPVYDVLPYRIWGMTAIITFQFLNILLDNKHFRHQLHYQSPIKD